MDEAESKALKRALSRVERGRGKRIPLALKARAVAHLKAGRREGASYGELGRRLGLSAETARRWASSRTRVSAPRTGAVPIEVVSEPVVARAVVLVTPSGHRVEGLSVAQLAELLQALT